MLWFLLISKRTPEHYEEIKVLLEICCRAITRA